MIDATQVLAEARETMLKRSAERDLDSERAMARTVAMFNANNPQQLTEAQGWQFMVFLKLARGSQGAFRLDDYVDAASYCALLAECLSKPIEE